MCVWAGRLVSGKESGVTVRVSFLTFMKVITCNDMSNVSVAAPSKA